MDESKIKERFKNDISKHEIEIIINQGLNRHLRFKRPGSYQYWFEIVTGKGFLLIRGDMGSFSFSRIEDMFNFFKIEKNDWNYGKDLPINPGYWGQKLESVCKRDGHVEFSVEQFNDMVMHCYNEFIENNDIEDEDKEVLLEDLENNLIGSPGNIHEAYNLATDFSCFDVDDFKIDHENFYDRSFEDFTYHYIWCLYAIVWGIEKYDEFIG